MPHNSNAQRLERRQFLSQLGMLAAASGLAVSAAADTAGAPASAAAQPPLPTIQLGKYQVTRLVAGWNPIGGHSYQGVHMDQHMQEYFTVDRTAEFLLTCERAGINTHQFSESDKATAILHKVREQGTHMQFLCLHSKREGIKSTVEKSQPIAVVHHGGVTDRLFSEGKSRQVHDYVKAAHDHGVLAGVSAHNPDCLQQIADEGWEVDFFMGCFYFLTRKTFKWPNDKTPPPETLEIVYPFYRHDPRVMTRVIQQVKQPCLGFKILGAGRLCTNQDTVRQAFRFAFENIKPTDGVLVGMYPRFFDEITANIQYTREFGKLA